MFTLTNQPTALFNLTICLKLLGDIFMSCIPQLISMWVSFKITSSLKLSLILSHEPYFSDVKWLTSYKCRMKSLSDCEDVVSSSSSPIFLNVCYPYLAHTTTATSHPLPIFLNVCYPYLAHTTTATSHPLPIFLNVCYPYLAHTTTATSHPQPIFLNVCYPYLAHTTTATSHPLPTHN